MNKPQETPGPWQREPGPFGRRYRMEKGVKCYEMTVNGIPQSAFLESNRRREEQQRAEFAAAQRKAAQIAAQRRNCPFVDADSLHTDCTEKCALFLNGCALARLTDRPPAKTTEGLCPFSKYRSKCRKDCALYGNGGCALTAVVRESEEGKHE